MVGRTLPLTGSIPLSPEKGRSMKDFFSSMLLAVTIGTCFAALVCGYVMVGTAMGYFHPNYSPELGETLTGFYTTLWMCSVAPFPMLVLLVAAMTATWQAVRR